MAPGGEQRDGRDVRAFVSVEPTGDIAVALGIALKDEQGAGGDNVLYHKAIGGGVADDEAVNAIQVQAAEVHLLFDRTLATLLGGRDVDDARKAVLVGAGAIGSHITQCLGREGRFNCRGID